MKLVQVLIPSLHPNLLDRMIASVRPHGSPDAELRFVVVGKYRPEGDDIDFVEEKEKPQGVYAASRLAIPVLDPDAVLHLTCDDVLYQPGWLADSLDRLMKSETLSIVGVRHGGGIGTCFGRMYANFPLVRVSDVFWERVRPHFMPEYLRGQWGDVALALALAREGGKCFDGGPMPEGRPWIHFADRMGYDEAKTKHSSFDADMLAIQTNFADFAKGWPRVFRGFNIDMPHDALDGTGSICEPDFLKFVARRISLINHSTMDIPL